MANKRFPTHFTAMQCRNLVVPTLHKSCPCSSLSPSLSRRPPSCSVWKPSGAGVNHLGNPLDSQWQAHISQMVNRPLCRVVAWKSLCQMSPVLLWQSRSSWKQIAWSEIAWFLSSPAVLNSSSNTSSQYLSIHTLWSHIILRNGTSPEMHFTGSP